MSYIDSGDNDILEDILNRKEFYVYKNKRRYEPPKNTIPLFMIDSELKKGNNLQFYSHQLFIRNFSSPDTPYSRLLLKHSTGSGKTIGAIGIAMNYIKYYRHEELMGVKSIGSVYVIGFDGAKKAFYKDLLRFPEFGFATRKELFAWDKLRHQAFSNVQSDIDRVYEYGNKIKKRIGNRKGNGFFKFLGYKALVNRLFISETPLTSMTEEDMLNKIKTKEIMINKEFINSFKNSIVFCDEIHNVYNSLQKNNWGLSLQIIFDSDPSIRAVLMSATPVNNNPTEIVDLLNLLLPKGETIKKSDLFENKKLKKKSEEKIKILCRGRVSYLMDKNPKLYPARVFDGEAIKGIKYIKFIRCYLTGEHLKTYNAVYSTVNKTISQESRYITDFILPNPNGKTGIYKSSDIRSIKMADEKWKINNNIKIVDGVASGTFLQKDKLKSVSVKYTRMINDIHSMIKRRGGKIMIYHRFVVMSGVLFIKEVLIHNGIIGETMASAPNTLCSICGIEKQKHVTDEKSEKYHVYKPVRFVIVHSDLDKNTREKSIDKYNRTSNKLGDDFMILIGSRMIKESYDFKGICNMLIMSRPDNIPTLIQIIGRAVRKNSHSALPISMRKVSIRIYTSSLPNKLSYSEEKYKEKIADYEVIQHIEKILHENAIDSVVNYETNKTGLDKNLGDLNFIPTLIQGRKKTTYKLSELNLGTFNNYHAQSEIDLVTAIIKRSFIEISPAWKYQDLSDFVRKPSFSVEYDTSLIAESHIVIALSRLLWSDDVKTVNPYISDEKVKIDIIDKIFDPMDKRLILPGGQFASITQIGDFYILFPVNEKSMQIHIDVPYRNIKNFKATKAHILPYLENASINSNFNDKRNSFYLKYKTTRIEHLSDAVCDYGVDFHVMFVEDCISYIFNSWTDWNIEKSKYHDFYFKMLYYYDIIGLIIFADTAKEFIYNEYNDYILEPTPEQAKGVLNDKNKYYNEDRGKRNLLNALARNISKSTCDWCPKVTKELYEHSLNKSLHRFSLIKKNQRKLIKVPPENLPIGHFLQKTPRFYHPDRGWFSSPEYLINKIKWVENPIIIGYNVKSKTGIHVRFKLRNPIQQIKIYSDARLIEKGSICSTRSKSSLIHICKKLKVKINSKSSITKICTEIKSRLMYLELIERSRETNLKFFYSHFEIDE
jgi:hypothetical protein